MARKRKDVMSQDLNSTKPLADEISGLLRSLGVALGEAYAQCATPTTVIEQLETAKTALFAARQQVQVDRT